MTTGQRITALERENTVLQDKIKLLHGMLKEQRQLISEYIRHAVVMTSQDDASAEGRRAEDSVYTFVCKQRFERVEKKLNALRSHSDEGVARRRAV